MHQNFPTDMLQYTIAESHFRIDKNQFHLLTFWNEKVIIYTDEVFCKCSLHNKLRVRKEECIIRSFIIRF